MHDDVLIVYLEKKLVELKVMQAQICNYCQRREEKIRDW